MIFLDTKNDKLGCVVRMVVDSKLSHAEFGRNDHQKDAPPFRLGQSRSSRKRMIPKKADNPDSGFLRRKQTIICSLFFQIEANNPNLLFVGKQTILSQTEDPFPMDFNKSR